MVQYAQITHTNITNFTRLSNTLPHHVALHHAAGTRTRAMTVARDPWLVRSWTVHLSSWYGHDRLVVMLNTAPACLWIIRSYCLLATRPCIGPSVKCERARSS